MAKHIVETKLRETEGAQKQAEHIYLVYTAQCEHMREHGFEIPREALEVSKDVPELLRQFSELRKEPMATSRREKRELAAMLDEFLLWFDEIYDELNYKIAIIHGAWQEQYFEEEARLVESTARFSETVIR